MNRIVRWFKDVRLKTDYFPFDLRNDHMELLDADYTVWDESDIEKVQDLVVQFSNGRPSWIPWVSYSGLFDGEIIPSYRMIEICKRIIDSGLAEKKNVVDKIEFIKNKSHLGYRFAFEG